MRSSEIQELIINAENIVLMPHVSMDGDALGSVLGMYWAIVGMKKKVRVIVEEMPPENLKFLPASDQVLVYEEGDHRHDENIDLCIALDTAYQERLGKREQLFRKASVTLNIDHHPTNTKFADFNYVVSDASATGEILFDVMKGFQGGISNTVATCLYTAISSDTGGFRYANTSRETHRIAGELIERGAKSAEISAYLFEDVTLKRLQVLSEIIQRLELYHQGKIAFIVLQKSIIDQLQATDDELNGYSNLGRSVRGVQVSVFIREKEKDLSKVSMRSRQGVDLTEVAVKFGGGGHKRAAGFTYKGNVEDLKDLLLEEFTQKT